jgi:hypothetical protein
MIREIKREFPGNMASLLCLMPRAVPFRLTPLHRDKLALASILPSQRCAHPAPPLVMRLDAFTRTAVSKR